ncbi:hypothetical protein [Spirosoma agri]|uniref:Uncharacterized protein n=1 Tax=Spirosoma agri TaxID=1987381 RepID=A0A6M0II49_9BACT|nr:hypothetical protein [Spirosoma agri]NEU67919.1 hypothetical protein [Spirosoma agri]
MYKDAVNHYFNEVMPAYEQYVKLATNEIKSKLMLISLARQSSYLLFNFREQLIPPYKKEEFDRNYIASLCPDYHWIGDVANAFKHRSIGRKDRIIDDVSQIEETLVRTCFIPEDATPANPYYSIIDRRVLVVPTDIALPIRDLLEIQTNVINFWSDFLVSENLTKERFIYKYRGDRVLTSQQADQIELNALIPVSPDGYASWTEITQFYDPVSKSFKRWGYSQYGIVIPEEISERAANAKFYYRIAPKS